MAGQRIRDNYILSSIGIVCGLLILICIDSGHNWGGDFSLYIAQAKALVTSSMYHLYELNKFSMDNSIDNIGPYLYPNGFPLLLAPAYFFFGVNYVIMKGYCGLFLILSIPVMYQLFKDHYANRFFVFFIIAFIVFNVSFVTFSNEVLSDLPFFFFSLLALYLMTVKNTVLNQVLLGICMLFSYFIRDVGIFLAPTLFVLQLQQVLSGKAQLKRWPYLAIPYVVFAGGFLLNYQLMPKGGENALAIFFSRLQPGALIDIMIRGGKYYVKVVVSFFLAGFIPGNKLFWVLSPIPVFMAIGVFSNWKDHLHFITFVTLIFLMLLIWPYCDYRFLFPVMPFLIHFMLKGILFVSNRVALKQKHLFAGLSAALMIFVFFNVKEIIRFGKMETDTVYTPEMRDIYGYLEGHVPKDQIIGFNKPRVLRLITDINSIYVDEKTFQQSPAKYLLIEKEKITGATGQYDPMFETPNYILVKKGL